MAPERNKTTLLTQACDFMVFQMTMLYLYVSYFYAPEIEDRGAYCFCPVCHSVLLSETLTLLITFEQ